MITEEEKERHRIAVRKNYWKNREKRIEEAKEWNKNHKEKRYEYSKRYKKNNPEKNRAHHISEKIPVIGNCQICGKKAEEKHHPDYSKPLEVIYLCIRCHAFIHRGSKLISNRKNTNGSKPNE